MDAEHTHILWQSTLSCKAPEATAILRYPPKHMPERASDDKISHEHTQTPTSTESRLEYTLWYILIFLFLSAVHTQRKFVRFKKSEAQPCFSQVLRESELRRRSTPVYIINNSHCAHHP